MYFRFELTDKAEIEEMTKIISIDNFTDGFVYAYANEIEYNNFLRRNIPYEILPRPGDVPNVSMSNNVERIADVSIRN